MDIDGIEHQLTDLTPPDTTGPNERRPAFNDAGASPHVENFILWRYLPAGGWFYSMNFVETIRGDIFI